MKKTKKKYFVFVDESGNNEQEELFALGCLFVPVDKIGEYYESLTKIKSKIITKVKQKECEMLDTLNGQNLVNFYKGRSRAYEVKFKHINETVFNEYRWLLSEYFRSEEMKFSCLVIDKRKYPNPKHLSFYKIYINQLVMLLKNNIADAEEIVLLPDDITISGTDSNYEVDINTRLTKYGKNIFGTHRLDSHSSIFVQIADLLTGAILYECKNGKNKYKKQVVGKIKEKVSVETLDRSFTKHRPNYFSVWKYRKR